MSPNTSYNYTVATADGNGNTSAPSSAIQVSTKRTLVFRDDFNRPDVNNLAFSTNWQTTLWGISFNTAIMPVSYQGAWRDAPSLAPQGNFQATAKFLHIPNYPSYGGIVFWAAAGSGRYRAYQHKSGGLYLSYFDFYGNETSLATASVTGGTPSTIAVQAVSSTRTITVFHNGVAKIVFTETDTSRPNSGSVGLATYIHTGAETSTLADDFTLEQ